MKRPTLYIFAISHYCEKARWALEYLGIEHDIVFLAPGKHRLLAKKLAAAKSSLPIMVVDDLLVQGSSEIINWAEENKTTEGKTLAPEGDATVAMEIEKRLDDLMGVHVRRYFYSEALVEYPRSVRSIFTQDLKGLNKLVTSLSWSVVRKIMIKGMDLGYEQHFDSRKIVSQELDWIDGLLADGKSFIVGDKFSRVDITAASLLSPLAQPAQHPTYTNIEMPPRVSADCQSWEDRSCLRWTDKIYGEYR